MIPQLDPQSTRPYLVRAIYEWCCDQGFTPYVAVQVDQTVQVPREFVRNGEIVLNVSYDATNALKLGNEFIEFKARFGGVSRDIMVPLNRVLAIYALENGQGMAFPVAPPVSSGGPVGAATVADPALRAPGPKKPHLSAVTPATVPATVAAASADAHKVVPLKPVADPAADPAEADGSADAPASANRPASGPANSGDAPEPPPPSRPTLTRVK
jgi:stringent starvation protein B